MYKKEKKIQKFTDHVTQVCEAHDRVLWYCLFSSRCRDPQRQIRRDRRTILDKMCMCRQQQEAYTWSKAEGVEREWNQHCKIESHDIKLPGPRSSKDGHGERQGRSAGTHASTYTDTIGMRMRVSVCLGAVFYSYTTLVICLFIGSNFHIFSNIIIITIYLLAITVISFSMLFLDSSLCVTHYVLLFAYAICITHILFS